MIRYFRFWRRAITLHFQVLTASRVDFLFFFVGKIARMFFFLIFFIALFGITKTVAGYTEGEVMLFFATMNLIDIVVQLFWYRGFTILPRLIKDGDFDFMLTKPISPLFHVAFHIFDFFDLTTMPVAIGLLWYAITLLPHYPASAWLLYSLFLFVGLILAFALNLFLASLTFYSIESANLWSLYRDLIYIARFPPEVFPNGVRVFFTYVIPILAIVSFPTKALLGRLSLGSAIFACVLSVFTLVFASKFWHRGLRDYASASS